MVLFCPWRATAGEAAPPPANELWLPEPAWAAPIRQVPLVARLRPSIQPEPIPLPPAVLAVVGPALLTAIVARFSVKKRRSRVRVMRKS